MSDYNKVPDVATIAALEPLLKPNYTLNLPLRDGWDTPFRYVRTGEHSFRIISAGADRQFDEKSWSARAETKQLSDDAVYAAVKSTRPVHSTASGPMQPGTRWR